MMEHLFLLQCISQSNDDDFLRSKNVVISLLLYIIFLYLYDVNQIYQNNYSFLKFSLRTQLHFEIAADFSLAGKEDFPFGLFDHQFQLAMRAIGGILRDYTP